VYIGWKKGELRQEGVRRWKGGTWREQERPKKKLIGAGRGDRKGKEEMTREGGGGKKKVQTVQKGTGKTWHRVAPQCGGGKIPNNFEAWEKARDDRLEGGGKKNKKVRDH